MEENLCKAKEMHHGYTNTAYMLHSFIVTSYGEGEVKVLLLFLVPNAEISEVAKG